MADPSSPVDWETVTAQLDDIDDVWKQARFDSLPHVVQVLTSHDSDGAVRRLQEQKEQIEELVDDVVRGYHNGFNKAIHNYSQILRLFSESAASIGGLKSNLDEARALLGAKHKQLHQQWCRSVTLRHVIALLDQIDKVAKVPAQIEKLIGERKFYAAVQLHIQSISMLEREGIQSVGALQDVRADLSKLRSVLFYKVMEELHLHLYNKGEYSYNLSIIPDKDDDISAITAVTVAPAGNLLSMSRRTRTMRRHDFQAAGLDRVIEAQKGSSVDGSVDGKEDVPANGGSADGSSEGGPHRAMNGGDEASHREAKRPPKELPPWLAESTPNDFTEAMTKSDASPSVKYLQTMVECLALLGKVAAAGAIISQKLRPTLHELITAEIKARAAEAEASRPRVDQVSKVSGGLGPAANGVDILYRSPKLNGLKHGHMASGDGRSGHEPVKGALSKAQIAAQELLESILELVLRILENHIIVGEAVENKAGGSESSSFAEKVNGDLQWGSDNGDTNRATGGYSLVFALTVLQSECQQLICDILRATPDAASADAAVQTARLASKSPVDDAIRGGSEEGLSFAFRFTDTILTSPAAGNDRLNNILGTQSGRHRHKTNAAQEGYGTGSVLPERGIYLTSAVYRPVLQYTDKVSSLLPLKYTQLGNDGLQTFIENFVKDQFLPIVRVDYRTRVADALASPSAFRLRSYPGAQYEASIEQGRPVLQGPLAANQLVTEVLGWAQAMPMYAGEILELVQTLLERTLDRCRAGYTEAVLGSLSSTVIGMPDVSGLMKQEPANAILEAGFLRQLGQNVVEKAFDGPLDLEVLELELELNNILLSLRPIKEEHLIKDKSKLVLLAALSDTLDYLSDSVRELGQHTTSRLTERRRRDLPVPQRHHHRRTSSALTAGLGSLADKFHALSSECLRTLRVEMQLQTIFYLSGIGKVYLCDQDAEEPEDFIISLMTQIARRDEEIAPYLPHLKRGYIFGGVCSIASATFIKALNEVKAVNMLGVRQICRDCTAVQQGLASVADSLFSLEERMDRVRTYYELLNLPFEGLISYVTEHDSFFSFSEYSNLIKVEVPGREVPSDAVQRIGKILAP